jgi:hypothetical protein
MSGLSLLIVANLADLGKTGSRTESDVKQKLILPLLTASEWLAIPITNIQTKQYLPPTQIDKGAGRKIGFYPDYSIWISAVPIMIVEAKSPIESTEEGFREAQLYAHELNKVFPTGINPVQFVLCVNGKAIRFGYWDSAEIADLSVADLKLGTAARHSLRSFIGYDILKREAATIKERYRPTQTYRPINFVGGEQALNRRIELNSFSIDIAPLVRMFFEPDSAARESGVCAEFRPQAARRKAGIWLVSCRSVTNFAKLELWGPCKRNSGRLWRSAVATTSSEGGMPGRMVRSQEPNEFQTSLG